MEIFCRDRTDNRSLKADYQFFTADIAFNTAVNMNNAVTDKIAFYIRIFADNARNRNIAVVLVHFTGKF